MGEVIQFTGVYRTEEEWAAIIRFETSIKNAARKAIKETQSLEIGPQLAAQAKDHSKYTITPLDK